MIHLNLFEEFSQPAYLKWKRKNVSLRGLKDTVSADNGGQGAILGKGLYTAALANKTLAKQYGTVKFVTGARPKKPLVFDNLNKWEIWLQRLMLKWGADVYDPRKFHAETSIEKEVQKLGYDGVEIKGREYVNYTPNEKEIRYFSTEQQLKNWYEDFVLMNESENSAVNFGEVHNNEDFKKFLINQGGYPFSTTNFRLDKEDLAQGLCGLVAIWMAKDHKDAKIHANFVSMGLLHALIEIDGKFYDGLDPQGKDKMEDMEFFKDKSYTDPKHFDEYTPQEFIKQYIEEYADEKSKRQVKKEIQELIDYLK